MRASQCSNKCLHAAHHSFISTHTTDLSALPSYPPQLCKLVALLVLLKILLKSYTYITKMFPSHCFKCQYINYSVVTLVVVAGFKCQKNIFAVVTVALKS